MQNRGLRKENRGLLCNYTLTNNFEIILNEL